MKEVQVWEATEKRWLKLKYHFPGNGLNYFFYLIPLKHHLLRILVTAK